MYLLFYTQSYGYRDTWSKTGNDHTYTHKRPGPKSCAQQVLTLHTVCPHKEDNYPPPLRMSLCVFTGTLAFLTHI